MFEKSQKLCKGFKNLDFCWNWLKVCKKFGDTNLDKLNRKTACWWYRIKIYEIVNLKSNFLSVRKILIQTYFILAILGKQWILLKKRSQKQLLDIAMNKIKFFGNSWSCSAKVKKFIRIEKLLCWSFLKITKNSEI